jgi:hypothetical protein
VPSEGFLVAIRSDFKEFSHLLPLSTDAELVYSAMSKFWLFERLLASGSHAATAHLPPCLLIRSSDGIPPAQTLNELPAPLFIKVDAVHSNVGDDSRTIKAETAEQAQSLLVSLQGRFDRVLVQGFVPGRGIGAFCLFWDDEVLARFMHLRLHEVPHTGGASSYRASWYDPKIMADAEVKLSHVRWTGVAMMEYRWNPSDGSFALMEMNARFWGSLHLALYAHVDFPRLLLDAFHGNAQHAEPYHWPTARCRYTFPKEVQYVWSRLKDSELSVGERLWSCIEFFTLAADPRVRSDLLFPGDRRLYVIQLRRFLRSARTRTSNRSRSRVIGT